jgi:transposase
VQAVHLLNQNGLNWKLHAVADANGLPIGMYLSAGQTSDYIGVRAFLESLPKVGILLADRGYDADLFRNALIERDAQPCIHSRMGSKTAIAHDADIYRKLHKIENIFASLKDWRRIVTHYGRCADLFLSACARATTFMFWLLVWTLEEYSI